MLGPFPRRVNREMGRRKSMKISISSDGSKKFGHKEFFEQPFSRRHRGARRHGGKTKTNWKDRERQGKTGKDRKEEFLCEQLEFGFF
jgi:hypothetical protein